MKKSIFILTIVVSVFSIYYLFRNEGLNYIALGDSLAQGVNAYNEVGYSYTDYLADKYKENNTLSYYTKKYAKSGYTTSDVVTDINTNNQLKKDLRESDVVTISVGANDFFDLININKIEANNLLIYTERIKSVISNVDNCIKEIRKYAKEDLIVVGYYNPIPFLFNTNESDIDKLFYNIDEEYYKICDNYNCKYISLYQLFKSNSDFLPNPNNIHPNTDGYEAIADLIFKTKNN